MDSNRKKIKQYIQFTTAGIQLVAFTLICVGLGNYLDEKLDTKPYLLLFGALFGIGGGLWYVVHKFLNIK